MQSNPDKEKAALCRCFSVMDALLCGSGGGGVSRQGNEMLSLLDVELVAVKSPLPSVNQIDVS